MCLHRSRRGHSIEPRSNILIRGLRTIRHYHKVNHASLKSLERKFGAQLQQVLNLKIRNTVPVILANIYRNQVFAPNHCTLKANPTFSGRDLDFGFDAATELVRERPECGKLGNCELLAYLVGRNGAISCASLDGFRGSNFRRILPVAQNRN